MTQRGALTLGPNNFRGSGEKKISICRTYSWQATIYYEEKKEEKGSLVEGKGGNQERNSFPLSCCYALGSSHISVHGKPWEWVWWKQGGSTQSREGILGLHNGEAGRGQKRECEAKSWAHPKNSGPPSLALEMGADTLDVLHHSPHLHLCPFKLTPMATSLCFSALGPFLKL